MASQIHQGNASGSGSVTIATPATNSNRVLTLPDVTGTLAVTDNTLGYGQTWQNMTSSRSAGTTYTNTTGRPIVVSINLTSTSPAQSNITVDGLMVGYSSSNTNTGSGLGCNAIVPPGSSYSAGVSAGTPTVAAWYELR